MLSTPAVKRGVRGVVKMSGVKRGVSQMCSFVFAIHVFWMLFISE